LIPRNPNRGEKFENVAFMGVEESLSPELRSECFYAEVQQLGLRWLPIYDKAKWPDYSEVDAVVALRAHGDPAINRKPATKLYNAWLAGVPAILGAESAFQHEGNPGYDYLEASSMAEVIGALQQLRDDVGLRRAIFERGCARARSLTSAKLCVQWIDLIENKLQPLYERWRAMAWWRRAAFFRLKRSQMRIAQYKRHLLTTANASNSL
jgi:hypothetical protein